MQGFNKTNIRHGVEERYLLHLLISTKATANFGCQSPNEWCLYLENKKSLWYTEAKDHVVPNRKYSRTCEEQPPRGNPKSGCSLQVVALQRFSYGTHNICIWDINIRLLHEHFIAINIQINTALLLWPVVILKYAMGSIIAKLYSGFGKLQYLMLQNY